MSTALFRMRLTGILRKEFLQIIRDPSSIILAVIMPIVLLFIFGYGVSLDAEHIPVAIVSSDSQSLTTDLTHRFKLSPNFTVIPLKSIEIAEKLLDERKVDGIIHIRGDFSQALHNAEQAPVQLIVNGIDANRARLIQGYVHNIIRKYSVLRESRGEPVPAPAVSISQRIWFNEEAESRNFLVPGLITLIMTLIGILLTALVVAREWERGTMEAMLVTPLRRIDILLGKIIPYYALGMIGMSLSVIFAIILFDVPFRGSIPALFLLSSLFMLASLGFGLFLSATIKVQFIAAQASIVAGFMPAFFLTGLIFDLESTPKAIQMISYIVPAKYFVTISHTLFMAGDVWEIFLPNGLVLGAMAIFFITMAYTKITKRLD